MSLTLRDNDTTPPLVSQTPPPTIAMSSAPTATSTLSERAKQFIDILKDVSAEADLLDSMQPQSEAVTWLTEEDEGKLDPSMPDADLIIERYLVVLLDYSWTPNFKGFRSAVPVCNWNDGFQTGIFFDESNPARISGIRLSKSFFVCVVCPIQWQHFSPLLRKYR